jgi:hypothetical protein
MAELARRTVARTWVGRRLALVGQTDILRLAAPGPARGRGIVGAADQSVITGAFRPAVTRAPLTGASREVAFVLAHTVTGTAGETRVVGAAGQPVVAVALHEPLLQRQPRLVQGADGGPIGLQPTEDGVHVPGPPGGPFGSLAQQRRVVSPQGSCVPVVQSQPTPGRDGSVQTSCTLGAARPACNPSTANRLAAIPVLPVRNAARRDR